MRKFLQIAVLGAMSVFALSACNKEEAPEVAAPVAVEVNMPTDPADTAGWKNYLVDVVKRNMEGVTTRPYMYFVPGGTDTDAQDKRINQLDNVSTVVARTVLPGNMMAFGGPDSAMTGTLIIDAFKEAKAGAFKGVVVLYVGLPADQQRVRDAIEPTGATFRFAEMK